MKRVAVLASGRGSNLGALIAARAVYASYDIALVVSNIETSGALDLARSASIQALSIPNKGLPREAHELMVLDAIKSQSIDVICLAGYMRVLGARFIDGFGRPILNIHPSLLPAFPGMHAQRQAIDAGVQWSGATVHFVDAGLDSGPIVLQDAVKVLPSDSEDDLAARILHVEHDLYPRALDVVARGAYEIVGRRVLLRQP